MQRACLSRSLWVEATCNAQLQSVDQLNQSEVPLIFDEVPTRTKEDESTRWKPTEATTPKATKITENCIFYITNMKEKMLQGNGRR